MISSRFTVYPTATVSKMAGCFLEETPSLRNLSTESWNRDRDHSLKVFPNLVILCHQCVDHAQSKLFNPTQHKILLKIINNRSEKLQEGCRTESETKIQVFTFQNHPELCSSRCCQYIWRVLHVTEVSPVVTELSVAQLYWGVLLVDVSNKLDSVFELRWPWKSFSIEEVENLQSGRNSEKPR